MKTYKLFLFSILSLLCISCIENYKKNIKTYTDFPQNRSLVAESIPNISDSIYPQSINLYNDKIILCDYESNPHFFVYKLPNFDFIGSFGKQGKGPTDIHDPVVWNQIENNKIGIYQINLMKFGFYDLDTLLESKLNKNKLNPIYMPPEINDAVNIISLKKDVFIGAGANSKGEFFIYNEKTKDLKWKSFISNFDKKFTQKVLDYDLMSEYKLGMIKIKPDKSMFVKSYIYVPVINVFDNNYNLKFTIKHKDLNQPIIDNAQKSLSPETKMYYTNCFLSDNYIYAVYRNCTLDDYSNYNCNNVEVHTFDWEGNPVIKYLLNEGIGPLSPFVLDEARDNIYTINPKTEDSYYSSFDIKDLP